MTRTTILLFTLATAVSGCTSEADFETGELASELTANGWLNDLQIGVASHYQVGVAGQDILYRDSSGRLRPASFDGTRWSIGLQTTLQADYGPALVEHGGQLVTIYHSAGQNRFLMSTSPTGDYWSAPTAVTLPVPANSTLRYAPAAASFNNMLHLGYCYRDPYGERASIARLENGTWRSLKTWAFPDGTCKSFAFGRSSDGTLLYMFTTEAPSTWYMYDGTISTSGSVSVGRMLSFKSKKPGSIVTCGGITHMVHSGYSTPDELWWTYRRVDGTWAPDARIPGQASNGGAALGCFGTRTIMVHNGGYDDLWWSEYVPD